MADLDGVWDVRRTGGLLPPLLGVQKRIAGEHGETRLGPFPGVPFRVEGLALRYRAPFGGFVDELEPDGDSFRGRALLYGREYGRFRLERRAEDRDRRAVTHLPDVTRNEQRARNEALFRSVNERLKEIDDRLDTAAVGAPTAEQEEFFCECGRLDCMARIPMSREDYETVRSGPNRFLVLSGHENVEIERVVGEHDGWLTVEKLPGAEVVAEQTDPRA